MKPKCKHCGSMRIQYRGVRTGAFGIRQKRFKCMGCGKWDYFIDKSSRISTPKILLFDIETLPMEVYTWRLATDYIPPSEVIKDWCILSWAAKWLFSSTVYSDVLKPGEAELHDDKRVIDGLWKLLDEADVVVAHNGIRFDKRMINTRFLLHGYSPPHSYQFVDTLREARKHFSFSSNKLDYINKYLGISPKIETNFNLWRDCAKGDRQALADMVEYNKQDVLSLEETYMTLRPWINTHPNLPLLANMTETACPICQSMDVKKEGFYHTRVATYAEYRCGSCGAIGRGRKSITPKAVKDVLIK